MKSKRSFRFGGIRLSCKKLQAAYPVPNAFLPTDAVIPLRQHSGPAAKRIVEPGEYIREGQLIGKASGFGSANIHSPIPGIVKEIRRIPDLLGGHVDAVAVSLEGSFERLGRKTEIFPWRSLSKHQILRAISEKGVVEDDDAGFPLFDRLHDPKGQRSSCVLVVNCIESDPWNSSTRAILQERASAVSEGILILKRILSPVRTIIALDAPEGNAGQIPAPGPSQEEGGAENLHLDTRYPQDLPTLLKDAIAGRKAISEEMLIITASTVASVYDAVVLNKPQIERYVTVSGDALKNPAILRVRIGTSVGEILEECGGFRDAPECILLNGPLRGSAVADLDLPILKTTRSIIALTRAETNRRSTSSCIRCGKCILGCPERIDPSRLFKCIARRDLQKAVKEGLAACTECGTCAYLCPSRLPLVQVFSLAKRDATMRGVDTSSEGRTA